MIQKYEVDVGSFIVDWRFLYYTVYVQEKCETEDVYQEEQIKMIIIISDNKKWKKAQLYW